MSVSCIHCIMVLWYYSIMVLWYYGTMVSWYYGIMVLWYHGTMVLWYYGIMVLWYHSTMVLWYYGIMVLWYYGSRTHTVDCNVFTRESFANAHNRRDIIHFDGFMVITAVVNFCKKYSQTFFSEVFWHFSSSFQCKNFSLQRDPHLYC